MARTRRYSKKRSYKKRPYKKRRYTKRRPSYSKRSYSGYKPSVWSPNKIQGIQQHHRFFRDTLPERYITQRPNYNDTRFPGTRGGRSWGGGIEPWQGGSYNTYPYQKQGLNYPFNPSGVGPTLDYDKYGKIPTPWNKPKDEDQELIDFLSQQQEDYYFMKDTSGKSAEDIRNYWLMKNDPAHANDNDGWGPKPLGGNWLKGHANGKKRWMRPLEERLAINKEFSDALLPFQVEKERRRVIRDRAKNPQIIGWGIPDYYDRSNVFTYGGKEYKIDPEKEDDNIEPWYKQVYYGVMGHPGTKVGSQILDGLGAKGAFKITDKDRQMLEGVQQRYRTYDTGLGESRSNALENFNQRQLGWVQEMQNPSTTNSISTASGIDDVTNKLNNDFNPAFGDAPLEEGDYLGGGGWKNRYGKEWSKNPLMPTTETTLGDQYDDPYDQYDLDELLNVISEGPLKQYSGDEMDEDAMNDWNRAFEQDDDGFEPEFNDEQFEYHDAVPDFNLDEFGYDSPDTAEEENWDTTYQQSFDKRNKY